MAIRHSSRFIKIKTNVRGLDVIQSVYAFAMALGLTQVFNGSQIFLTRILSGTTALTDEKTLLAGLMLVNVIMLGLRFFWVPRNLQDLVIAAAHSDAIAPERGRQRNDLSNFTITYHLVLIVLHGALFFLVCGEFEFVVFSISSHLPMSPSVFLGYVLMHAALLLMNAAWIALIKRQELQFEQRPNLTGQEKQSAGNVWWRNNLISSLIALSPFAISSTCRSASMDCVQQSLGLGSGTALLFPTSPEPFVTVYYDVAAALSQLGFGSAYGAVYWVFLVFFGNSLYDLLNAGRFYVFFQDVEWEDTMADGSADAPPERS